MSKWYEVEVQTLTVYAVEVKDDENENRAIDIALDEAPFDGRSTGSAAPLPVSHLEMIRKNADKVLRLDPYADDEEDDE